jgi:Cu+-exporting ATPase
VVEVLEKNPLSAPPGALKLAAVAPANVIAPVSAACFHCGDPCPDDTLSQAEKVFCCRGCLVVHDLLAESGLGQFYELSRHPGVRVRRPADDPPERWAYLNDPTLQQRLLDFTDGKVNRITFRIPAIHCVACVWLLENLFRLHPGFGESRVNFLRREVSIRFSSEQLPLSRLVELLASIGYEPQLTLGELEKAPTDPLLKRRWLQVGVAGFAFGNIMLFSIPSYFGLDALGSKSLTTLFGYLSLVLAAPVLLYSASDYWRSALTSARQKVLTLDVPIALGLAAIFGRSAFEILSGRGAGYLDSLTGLVFFLLCGRAFQNKTHERLAFDRDYKCFFPLSVRRRRGEEIETAALSHLRVGDRLLLRNGELIPADVRLVSGGACIDYSFVTGESEPVNLHVGDYLYAGGQQVGGSIEVETVKPVSQSYLTSLWNHEAFKKERPDNLNSLTNRYSRRFTRVVIAAALGAALFWVVEGQGARGLKAFTSVLIVACPCALALAAPFALGTAQRLLGRSQVFLKNVLVLERMAQVDTIVFDKTGTLTSTRSSEVSFHSLAPPPTAKEIECMTQLVRHSTHPHSVRIGEWLRDLEVDQSADKNVDATSQNIGNTSQIPGRNEFSEIPGLGISANVQGHTVQLGSKAWLSSSGVELPTQALPVGSASHLSMDGKYRGTFVFTNPVRPKGERLLAELGEHYELALLSGDNERERDRFAALFGHSAKIRFNQTPLDKLGFIRDLQADGKQVMMVGDGLNDAGALKQSDVGVAVVEKVGAFSPASDVILEAGRIPNLFQIIRFARASTRIVRWSFGISAAYNILGISIAAAGLLSPLFCAVLMPISSVTVVLFACGLTACAAKQMGLKNPETHS